MIKLTVSNDEQLKKDIEIIKKVFECYAPEFFNAHIFKDEDEEVWLEDVEEFKEILNCGWDLLASGAEKVVFKKGNYVLKVGAATNDYYLFKHYLRTLESLQYIGMCTKVYYQGDYLTVEEYIPNVRDSNDDYDDYYDHSDCEYNKLSDRVDNYIWSLKEYNGGLKDRCKPLGKKFNNIDGSDLHYKNVGYRDDGSIVVLDGRIILY